MKIHKLTKTLIGSTIPKSTIGSVLFIGSNRKLAENNSNLFWNNSRNRLGIGTNSPGEELSIDDGGGAGGDPQIGFNLGRFQIRFEGSIARGSLVAGGGRGLRFTVNTSTIAMDINSSGMIGINEISPDAMLEIVTSSSTEEGLKIKGSASQTGDLLDATDNLDNILASIDANGLINSVAAVEAYRSYDMLLYADMMM